MKKYKNVYVIGVFDLFHLGHVRLLKKCKELGENVIVALNSDRFVSLYKRPPINSEKERLEIVTCCKYVDEAFIIDRYDNKPELEMYQIDAIVHGDDWERSSYLKQIEVTEEYLASHNIDLILLPYTEGVSTSDIIKRIKSTS
jgi:glycerol-3-phosphate cytidylyltransferase